VISNVVIGIYWFYTIKTLFNMIIALYKFNSKPTL